MYRQVYIYSKVPIQRSHKSNYNSEALRFTMTPTMLCLPTSTDNINNNNLYTNINKQHKPQQFVTRHQDTILCMTQIKCYNSPLPLHHTNHSRKLIHFMNNNFCFSTHLYQSQGKSKHPRNMLHTEKYIYL